MGEETNAQQDKAPPKPKRFTVWDYLINLLSARESKYSLMALEAIICLGLAIYFMFTKQIVPEWISNVGVWNIIGVVAINALGYGLNYMYNSYNQNQQQQQAKVSYDIDENGSVGFFEYWAAILCAKEEKFSTAAFLNIITFGLACYFQFTIKSVDPFLIKMIQWTITGLAAINISAVTTNSYGYGGMSSYGMYGGYSNYGTTGVTTDYSTSTTQDEMYGA